MRKLVVCLPFALMACSGAEQAPEDVMVAEIAEDTAQATYDGGPVEGVFKAVSSEGAVLTQTTNSDGSILSVDDEGNSVNGTYIMSDDRFCITSEGEDSPACYVYSDLQDDGSWTATNENDGSDIWTLRRVDGQ